MQTSDQVATARAARILGGVSLAIGLLLGAITIANAQDGLAQIRAEVTAAIAPVTRWDGPATGPKAAADKFVVFVSSTQQSAGNLGVSAGAKEAAKAIGWRFQLIDGLNSANQNAAAIEQAIALKPDAIIVSSIPVEQFTKYLTKAAAQGIKVISWHGAFSPGPVASDPEVLWNVSTDPYKIGYAAASYPIVQSNGKAQVVLIVDPEYQIAVAKANGERDAIKACGPGCKVLSEEFVPFTEISTQMPSMTSSLLQRFGSKLTHIIAFNEGYLDFAIPTLRAAGVPASGPPQLSAAGDSSIAAYERIRTGRYESSTVPEPLNLHGWQLIDELNRAFNGQKPSGYVTPVHLLIKNNVDQDGGKNGQFDPENGYRGEYKRIWGKQGP